MSGSENLFLAAVLFQSTGTNHLIREIRPISGGDINEALKVTTDQHTYFVKWNTYSENLFERELHGLSLLRECGCVGVPQAFKHGQIGDRRYLVLEYLHPAPQKDHFWESFGQSIARLHQHTADYYGLDHDNHIGRLPQMNQPTSDWIDFFIENRLEVQIRLAHEKGLITTDLLGSFEKLYGQLESLIPAEPASLLHGDLWGGNFMSGPGGEPYIYDPAVYYGHREMDLAFTRLFGGFEPDFYEAYDQQYPLEPGFEERADLYNLYPMLVHVNLFGPSYLTGIRRTLKLFL
ncbi:fructosamine kinase family protein [Marinoscillum luteum]|uniref:Fructosamine kinase family protein n=1 Tax=Marinoscillum luteum TaxID=861051 RepID=A0ABW7NBR6_9BACT